MRLSVLLAIVAATVHAGIWYLTQDQRQASDVFWRVASMSYTAFEGQKRAVGARLCPTPDVIRADLKAVQPLTRVVRTYSSTEGLVCAGHRPGVRP